MRAVVDVETGEELLPARLLTEKVAAAAWRKRWREGTGARDRGWVGGRGREAERREERKEDTSRIDGSDSVDAQHPVT